jgi:hypothetical protein
MASNREYVNSRDGAPSYLDDLRSIGDYAYRTDGFTTIGLYGYNYSQELRDQCWIHKIAILGVIEKGKYHEFTINVPWHLYRPTACLDDMYEMTKHDIEAEFKTTI